MQNLEYKITKDVAEIHEKFATLQTRIRESLSSKVCAKNIAAHVIAYGIVNQSSDEKLKFLKHDTLEEVFSILSDHWSFLDYDLLKSIVKNYGSEDEESEIEKYQKQLKLFCERRVSEVPKEFIQLQKKSEHDLRDKVIIKLKLDHPKLKDIKDLKSKLCNVMSIEPATLQIVNVHLGCVEVIFLVSKHISYVFERPLTEQQWKAFQSASIVCLSYGALQFTFVVSSRHVLLLHALDILSYIYMPIIIAIIVEHCLHTCRREHVCMIYHFSDNCRSQILMP